MLAYSERATQLACDSSVAVQVLLGTTPGDCEFIPLRPRPADANMLAGIAARWPGRGLRSVGVIGLCGITPCYALKEPLEPEQVSVLTDAFLAYLHALYCHRMAAHLEQAEINELTRVWSLNDPRMEA